MLVFQVGNLSRGRQDRVRTLAEAATDHMEGSHMIEVEVEECDRHFAEGWSILATKRMLLQPQQTGLHLPERGQGRFPLASGSWPEGMRLSSRSATRLLKDPAGLFTGLGMSILNMQVDSRITHTCDLTIAVLSVPVAIRSGCEMRTRLTAEETSSSRAMMNQISQAYDSCWMSKRRHEAGNARKREMQTKRSRRWRWTSEVALVTGLGYRVWSRGACHVNGITWVGGHRLPLAAAVLFTPSTLVFALCKTARQTPTPRAVAGVVVVGAQGLTFLPSLVRLIRILGSFLFFTTAAAAASLSPCRRTLGYLVSSAPARYVSSPFFVGLFTTLACLLYVRRWNGRSPCVTTR